MSLWSSLITTILSTRTWGWNLTLGPSLFCPLPISIFVSFLAVCHASRVCYDLKCKNVQGSRTQMWFAVMVLSFGGTTLAAILLGIHPSWIASNSLIPTYTLIYVLFFNTKNRFFKITRTVPLFSELLFTLGDSIARTMAITSFGIDTIRLNSDAPLANSMVACVITGTLSGCGGGLVDSIFNVTKQQWTLGTPMVITNPKNFKASLDFWVAFVTSLVYLGLTESGVSNGMYKVHGIDVGGVWDHDSAKAICAVFVIICLEGRVLEKYFGSYFSALNKTVSQSPAKPVKGKDEKKDKTDKKEVVEIEGSSSEILKDEPKKGFVDSLKQRKKKKDKSSE